MSNDVGENTEVASTALTASGKTDICDGTKDQCTAGQHFSLTWSIVLLVAWIGVYRVQSLPSALAVAVVMLTWLFGCSRTRRATWLVLPMMFVPTIPMWLKAYSFGFTELVNPQIGLALLSFDESFLAQLPLPGLALFVTIFLSSVTVIRFFPKALPFVIAVQVIITCLRGALWMVLGNC